MNFDILVWLLSRYGLADLVGPNIPNAKKAGMPFYEDIADSPEFPRQYKHLGPALAARGDQVVALTPKVKKPARWQGIDVVPYAISLGNGKNGHPWVTDLETKVIRAEACYLAAVRLRDSGFTPDVILAHHG